VGQASEEVREDALIPVLPLSSRVEEIVHHFKESKLLPSGVHEGGASNWRTYFGSLESNIMSTVYSPQEEATTKDIPDTARMIGLYEIKLGRAVELVNAVRAQIEGARNYKTKIARIIEEEGKRALLRAVQIYESALRDLSTEQADVEKRYAARDAANKERAQSWREEGERRAQLFEADAAADEVVLRSLKDRNGALLSKLRMPEKS
jgi:hypothetical protein